MRRLIPAAIFGITALTMGGCAHGDKSVKAQEPKAQEPHASWSCPVGSYPDVKQKLPNCLSTTPWEKGTTEQTPEQKAQAEQEQSVRVQAAREQGAKEQAIKDQEILAQALERAKTGGGEMKE